MSICFTCEIVNTVILSSGCMSAGGYFLYEYDPGLIPRPLADSGCLRLYLMDTVRAHSQVPGMEPPGCLAVDYPDAVFMFLAGGGFEK